MSTDVASLPTTLSLDETIPTAAPSRTDVVYYGGDEIFTAGYSSIEYFLKPRAAVRISPRFDYTMDKLTGKRDTKGPRIVANGGDGPSIAAKLEELYGEQGVVMLMQDGKDAGRMEQARARSLAFRVNQANHMKEQHYLFLSRLPAGALAPPIRPEVKRAILFLHEVNAGFADRKRFVTRDGDSFETFDLAAYHLRTHWPDMVQASGGVEALITDTRPDRTVDTRPTAPVPTAAPAFPPAPPTPPPAAAPRPRSMPPPAAAIAPAIEPAIASPPVADEDGEEIVFSRDATKSREEIRDIAVSPQTLVAQARKLGVHLTPVEYEGLIVGDAESVQHVVDRLEKAAREKSARRKPR